MESGVSCIKGNSYLVVKETIQLTCWHNSPVGHSSPKEDLPSEQDSQERLWQQGFAATFLRKQKEVWKNSNNNNVLSPSCTEPWLRPC